MLLDSFITLFWREFPSIRAGAEYFHVTKPTITRWLSGKTPVNPMAEKLLIIKASGFLPLDNRWSGFRVDEEKAVLVTPCNDEYHPKELELFGQLKAENRYWREKYGEPREMYPRIVAQPSKHPFTRGNKRGTAPWIPTAQRDPHYMRFK